MDEEIDSIDVIEYDDDEFDDLVYDDSLLVDLDYPEDVEVFLFNPEDDPTEEVVCVIGEISPEDFSTIESDDLELQDVDEL